MSAMQTVTEIRHANLLFLIKQAGSVQAFADQVERSHSQISQLKNRSKHSKTGEPREVGDDMARHIEARLDLQTGWMDAPHSEHAMPSATEPATREATGSAREFRSPGDALMMAAALVAGLQPEQREQIAQLATMIIKNGPSPALAAAVDDIAKAVVPVRSELSHTRADKAQALTAYAQQAMAAMSGEQRQAFAEVVEGLGLVSPVPAEPKAAEKPQRGRPRASR